MKKTLLLSFALLLSMAMFAQSRAILLNETFETTSTPAGWEVYNGGGPNWSVRNTNKSWRIYIYQISYERTWLR